MVVFLSCNGWFHLINDLLYALDVASKGRTLSAVVNKLPNPRIVEKNI